ncbi:Crp/Fnr family transcriptional regulator [Aestuariibius sp. 2305UL40-4]|uniref:Crp/Fnr family transcriptional regulator n=1 Tax=Aestuariibius violaceus TaxID=3234132 RepID=UPI00345E6DBE
MSRYTSSLLIRLERYLSLLEDERTAVARLEKAELRLDRGTVLLERGEASEKFYVLKSGWAVVRTQPRRGHSSIARIYLPGEVIGFAEIGLSVTPHTVVMQTDGTVGAFGKDHLPELWVHHPRLMSLLTALSSLDQIALRDQIFTLTRLDARDRLIYFLLSLRSRLAVSIRGMGDRFQLPFNQQELGDVLGITSVYVNKILRQLSDAGEIEIDRPYIRLLEREKWIAHVDFIDRFAEVDTSWFPRAA